MFLAHFILMHDLALLMDLKKKLTLNKYGKMTAEHPFPGVASFSFCDSQVVLVNYNCSIQICNEVYFYEH